MRCHSLLEELEISVNLISDLYRISYLDLKLGSCEATKLRSASLSKLKQLYVVND